MIRNRKVRSEGVRRLSLAVGGACVLPWLIFFFVGALIGGVTFEDLEWRGWTVFVLVSIACFLVGWSAVRVVVWVGRGFARDKRRAMQPTE